MAWFQDSLRSAIAAINPFGRGGYQAGPMQGMFSSQLAIAAYLSSGMLRKVINIPAADRVREWRDWQADKPAIAAIEAEEKRLGLQAKVKYAEVLRGLGGGALVLVTAGDHTQPLDPNTIGKGGLLAVNAVSRWQIQPAEFVRELASPDYGMPSVFKVVSDGRGGATRIHPSRVVCFRGDPLPAGSAVTDEEAFWGDSRLLRVLGDVNKSDNASLWFSQLVQKAKLLRIGIPDLADMLATQGGQAKLEARVATIAEGEGILNATVYSSGSGTDGAGGEKITDYQMVWNGIPAVQDMFDQRIAAVSDIPFTRLMGRSPAGMNATGAYDDQNWAKAVSAGQQLETRPCLEQFDPVLIRSAGVADPTKVTWKWAPLWSPTEAEEAATFKTFMEAFEKVQNGATIPERAFAEAFQNFLEEREYLPGLSAALAKVPEAERFGIAPDDDGSDPSALTQTEGGDPVLGEAGGDGSVPRRRAANDKVSEAEV